MKALDSCASVAIRLKTVDLYCLRALYNRVEYCLDIGDFSRCISYAGKCELLAGEYARKGTDKAYADGMTFIGSCSGYKASALLKVKNYKAAEVILSNKVSEYQKSGDVMYLGTIYEQLAEIQADEGNFEKALSFFNRALNFEGKSHNDLGRKQILGQIGYLIYYKHLLQWDKAFAFDRKALLCVNKNKLENAKDAMESLNILCNMANIWVRKGRYDSALRYFQLAFNQIKQGADETTILKSSLDEFIKTKTVSYLTSLLIDKGDCFFQIYITTHNLSSLHQAIGMFKMSDKILDRIKSEQSEISSKLFWRSDSRRLYEHAIEASFIEKNPTDAFYFFEKSRAVLLSDQLNQLSESSNEDILKLAQIKRRILQFEREQGTKDTSDKRYAEAQAQLFADRQELDLLEQTIRQNNPLYYQSFLDTGFISLQDVQKIILKNHHGMLEIFSGDSADYSLLITPQETYFHKINKQDFDSTTAAYILYLSDPSLINRRFEDFVKTASHLHHLIFQNDPVPIGRIIISPDGQSFPFEPLVTNNNAHVPAWFLMDHAVSYTYSARYLLTQFDSNKSESPGNFLGLAPVRYSPGYSLASLEGSDLSLVKIGSYFIKSRNFVADDATRNNFLQHYSDYEIIQLYTHASDSSSHDEPVIYFADSSLYLSDLIPENKPLTRLVILSACETALGKLNPGEGVFSFNRGFASLGIPSSITNLWSVDNQSTYQITELFYKYLSAGEPIDIALQKAKIDFIRNSSRKYKLPYYWAAAILAGKSDAIEVGKMHPWKDILMILVLLAISFFIFKKWGKNKSWI